MSRVAFVAQSFLTCVCVFRSCEEARDPAVLQAQVRKLHHARANGGVVITTPDAIKSIMLKYVDVAQSAADMTAIRAALPATVTEQQVQQLDARIVTKSVGARHVVPEGSVTLCVFALMWKALAVQFQDLMSFWGRDKRGVLILDEVDLILHPLKSEVTSPCACVSSLI